MPVCRRSRRVNANTRHFKLVQERLLRGHYEFPIKSLEFFRTKSFVKYRPTYDTRKCCNMIADAYPNDVERMYFNRRKDSWCIDWKPLKVPINKELPSEVEAWLELHKGPN